MKIVGRFPTGIFGSRLFAAFSFAGFILAAPHGDAQTCAPTPLGLAGWWRGENDTKDVVSQTVGVPIGNVGFTDGVVGQGFTLDGYGSGVSLGNPSALRMQDLTIEAWVRRADSNIVSRVTSDAVLFSYGSGGYGFGMNSDGTLFLSQIDSSNVKIGVGVSDTNFHHLAVTKAGQTVVFYIDGVAYSAPAYNVTFGFTTSIAIGVIGDRSNEGFYGAIDEISIYNRPLSAAEIHWIYNAGSAGKCAAPTPPAIVTQPSNQTAELGSNVLFKVTPAGTSPLSFQWQFLGTNLNGATLSTLSLTNVQTTQDGPYQVMITNAYGSVTSQIASLNVVAPPAIRGQPQNFTTTPGSPAAFTVEAAGTLPLSFQWRLNGGDLPSATHYSLVFPSVQLADAGDYTVVITNVYGVVTSAPAALVLSLPPTITNPPTSLVLPTGANSSFSVAADGTRPLSYQWQFAGANLLGASSAALALFDVQPVDEGQYRVIVSNAFGAITSAVVALSLTNPICAALPAGLVGWWQGEGSTADADAGAFGSLLGHASFGIGKVGKAFVLDGYGSGVSLGNSTNLQLQDFTIVAWVRRADSAIVSRLTSDAVLFSYGSGGYGFGLNGDGTLFLSRIDVNKITISARITDTNFHHLAVTKVGTNVVFYIDGSGYPAPAFTGSFSFDTPAAIGVIGDRANESFLGTLDELELYNRPLSQGEIQSLYFATSQGQCPIPLSWVGEPSNQTVTLGSNVTLAATVAGAWPVNFQWYLNEAAIRGATNPTLSLNGVTFFQAGAYSLTASNALGPISTSNVDLTVLSPPLVANGGFETGDSSGWLIDDIAFPFAPVTVRAAGYNAGFGFFTTTPTDGHYCLTEGFDGNGPGLIRAAIDVMLPPSPVTLTFNYRAAWDMLNYGLASLPRTFGVTIEPFGGGAALQQNTLLTAAAGTTNYDTGNLEGTLDLSAFLGRPVRISFDANIPESFTGPGFLQLDNVVFSYPPTPPLAISRAAQQIILSWPAAFTNFVVFEALNFEPSNWAEIDPGLIVQSPTNNSIILSVMPDDHLFRLRSR